MTFPTVAPPFPGPARRRLPTRTILMSVLAGGLVAGAAFWWPPLGPAAGVVAAVFFGLATGREA